MAPPPMDTDRLRDPCLPLHEPTVPMAIHSPPPCEHVVGGSSRARSVGGMVWQAAVSRLPDSLCEASWLYRTLPDPFSHLYLPSLLKHWPFVPIDTQRL